MEGGYIQTMINCSLLTQMSSKTTNEQTYTVPSNIDSLLIILSHHTGTTSSVQIQDSVVTEYLDSRYDCGASVPCKMYFYKIQKCAGKTLKYKTTQSNQYAYSVLYVFKMI